MEFLKSALMPLVVKFFIGTAPTTGVGFSVEKLMATLRIAGMAFVGAGSLAALVVFKSVDYGLLAGLATSLITGAQAYILLHFSNFIPKDPSPPAG